MPDSNNLNNLTTDLFIIGGGINGCGIAYDAAGRGLSVRLCEMRDLASETSSYSSKLIHGGLRYLEYYEFRLVREALKEREVLLKIAPHLVHPLHILMPHDQHHRPAWLIRLGLFLYDHLNLSQTLPKSCSLKINPDFPEEPLKHPIKTAFEYSDCTVDDARLVLHLALGAQQKSAQILTHHRVEKIVRNLDLKRYEITVFNTKTNTLLTFYSKAVVNAAGPWIDDIFKNKISEDSHIQSQHHVRLIKGSHIIIKKLYAGDHAYILQNSDKRIVFVIPYREHFTLIGTTDLAYTGDPHEVKISPEEAEYLMSITNQYFKTQINQEQIIWSYAGVRPLQSDAHDNPSKVTRDYTLELNDFSGTLPFLSIFGGKITTFRKLAEHALKKLNPYFSTQMGPAWTHQEVLPGGNFSNFKSLVLKLRDQFSFLNKEQAHRIAYAYGTRAFEWLREAKNISNLGIHFGHGLTESEVDFMIRTEFARSTQDILNRRSKFVLHFSEQETQRLQDYLDGRDDWI